MTEWEHKFQVYKSEGGEHRLWYVTCIDPRCQKPDIMRELVKRSPDGYWGRRTREEAHSIGVLHQETEILKSLQVRP